VAEEYRGQVVWAQNQEEIPPAGELRERLARTFLVVSPEEFFANIEEYRRRIADAPARERDDEEPMEFPFYPALDDEPLQLVWNFVNALDEKTSQVLAERAIPDLTWFTNSCSLACSPR
jgi:hypothetical protein